MPEFTKDDAATLMNALLFRDNHGNAYSDDCANNRVIRKVASQFEIELREKTSDPDEFSKKSRARFGSESMK